MATIRRPNHMIFLAGVGLGFIVGFGVCMVLAIMVVLLALGDME